MPINLTDYFDRIGYKGSRAVSTNTFKKIHAAHVFSIPFEDLEIHEQKNVNNISNAISLNEENIFKKLVTDKRGGYCHETNELLALVLMQLGFQVDRLAARVLTAPDLPISHKLLVVTIDKQQWIADVGFGGYGLLEPIPLIADEKIDQYHDSFKLSFDNKKYTLQMHENGTNTWKSLYEFTSAIFQPIDFITMNYYVSHSPDSIFVKRRLVMKPTREGRIILNNYHLAVTKNGNTLLRTLRDENEYRAALIEHFGINLSDQTWLKPLQENPSNTDIRKKSWCHFFSHSLLGVGVASTLYIANEIQKK